MSHRPFQVFAHVRAFREDAGQQEREQYGKPAVDRKASIEMAGCAGVEMALAIAPITMLSRFSASSAQAITCKRDAFAAMNGAPARIQRNHIVCAFLVWVWLKALAVATGRTVYQLKHELLDDYLIQQLKRPTLQMALV